MSRGSIVNTICHVAVTSALAACAPSASQQYTPPTTQTIQNSLVLNDSFDVVWDRLIKNLSKEFFVINNVEKVSRIINVSFSTNQPSEFITCGSRTRQYVSASGGTESTTYDPARPSTFKTVDPASGQAYQVVRNPDLEGRVNIYVAPSGETTDVQVNTRYVLKLNVASQYLNNLYGFPIGSPSSGSETFNFDTNRPLDTSEGGERIACTANGELEKRILDAAR